MGLGLEADLYPAKNGQMEPNRIITGRSFAGRSQSISKRKKQNSVQYLENQIQ